MTSRPLAAGVIAPFFILTYVALAVNGVGLIRDVRINSIPTAIFVATAFVSYCLLFLSPVILICLLARLVVGARAVRGRLIPTRLEPFALLAGVLIITTSFLQILVFADRFIHRLYGRHLDGFVRNVIFTPGGIDSLGSGTSTTVSFALIMAGFVALQAGLLWVVVRFPVIRRTATAPVRGRRVIGVALFFLVSFLYAQGSYGVSMISGNTPVLAASTAVPGFLPITFTKLAKKYGYKVVRSQTVTARDIGDYGIRYPLAELVRRPPERKLNLVYLIAESLRADMLTPEIMPHTWAFGERAIRCTNHYSGGNGTRMAIFSMFYGLYGPYWFPFLQDREGPVLIDELIEQHYDMHLYTSAAFTYPEFDRTAFVRVPQDRLHNTNVLPIYERDAQQITALLASLDARPTTQPFLRYMFFETTHANYHFPKDAVIREPYCKDLNYATMDVEADIGPMKNRYINACHYLDTQIARVLAHLEQSRLLDSTIVIITGDHGEEFMEKGRWGHNSEFSEEQTLVPFVIWVPGREPQVISAMTSHLDVPATLLPMLGVMNDPADYSLGRSLFSPTPRAFTVIGDWDRIAVVDDNGKMVIPVGDYGFSENILTDRNDKPVKGRTARRQFLADRSSQTIQVMRDLKRFEN